MQDASYDLIKTTNEVSRAAGIQQAVEGRRRVCFSVTLDLSTAQLQSSPLELAFPFRTWWVEEATDSSAVAYLIPNPKNEGNLNAPIPLKENLAASLKDIVSGGQLYWTAQSGKTMTIFFFVDADVRPGSMVNTIAGGVSVSDGDSLASNKLGSAGTSATVALAAKGDLVCPSDTSRKKLDIYFDGPCWLGDASVQQNVRGIYWPGGIYEHKSTAALYCDPTGTGTVNAYGNYFS